MISEDLIAAYRATRYRVDDDAGVFWLLIDQWSEPLARLQARCGVESSAFLTAWNPHSVQRTDAENAHADAELREAVKALGLKYVPGFGEDPAGLWPGEASMLILGCDEVTAMALALRFGQNAFVFADADARPRLRPAKS